jgi:hypothetical protein
MSEGERKPRMISQGLMALISLKHLGPDCPPYPFPGAVSKARTILEHAPMLADYVLSEQVSFYKVYREALRRKRQVKKMVELKAQMDRDKVY